MHKMLQNAMEDDNNRSKKPLSAKDVELWRQMTADVKVNEGKSYQEGDSGFKKGEKPHKKQIVGSKTVKKAGLDNHSTPKSVLKSSELDRRTDSRLRKGQIAIEARLDLHGFRQDDAHDALHGFLRTSYNAGKRCVLVITGRGARNDGVLRMRVPQWVSEPGLKDIVLKSVQAQIKDGGDGAFYIYLRKKR